MICWYAADCSPNNRKDAASWPELQESYYTLINISSKTAKRVKNSSYDVYWLKKVYEVVSQGWIIDCLKVYTISCEVIKFFEYTIENWKMKIQRGIFQGDVLSTLLFVKATMPLNHILSKCTGGYNLMKIANNNQSLNIPGQH